MNKRHLISALLMSVCTLPYAGGVGAEETLSGREIMERCNYKNPGKDQRSTLTIILKDKDQNEKKNVYSRYWKDYSGADGIADKMVLFTEFPPDAKGAAFMRWAYAGDAEKNADQWVYLPVLKKIRRVSIRDPGDSFLGSDLTYADISGRALDADEHTLARSLRRGTQDIFAVENTPRDQRKTLYSKTVSWFAKQGSWDSCVKRQVDYYDKKGQPLKQQILAWQQVNGAWVWDEVTVRNVQTGHSSIFRVRDVQINVGLNDEVFTERALRLGAP